ncbi:ATP-binding protein [Chromobacterium alticapitis]|uniref:ATP-binding protein n=1 Tax=Chromobacterium alticapitis TaxID=2073169 RepID=A0A2S5DG28_9NEIS|nr:ATP-binding protein [Chromobacterium alticapitis]POZ61979.1 hypothetical protein C2I19_10835 [Chromobacterium alticapitis]
MNNKPFKLEFSNRVIEHLGIKLYQNKPTNVVAEFLSNSWDADATKVFIDLKTGADQKPYIVITDNGRGMTRNELTDEFLIIGRNRRNSPSDKTAGGRSPMGRKGIGKLAGFGIASVVDVLSLPNPKIRTEESAPEPLVYWLRFHLSGLIEASTTISNSVYEPEVIADGVTIEALKSRLEGSEDKAIYDQFISNAQDGEGGVCVYLSNTSLKKAMNIDQLLQSMGRRFTVSMLRADFDVRVNGKQVTPEDALPPLHSFGFGEYSKPETENIKICGESKEVRYWVRFVNLPGSDWSIEQAGIGIYAHGKIAQDRPFFFDLKGKEIMSRYIYGVIEADWLDELPVDVVSTDRRSIDWDTEQTAAFHTWGQSKASYWIEEFRKWRAQQPKNEIIKRIREVSGTRLSGTEEEALAELLNEVLPSLADDEETKNKTTRSFAEAWTHTPTRVLTQSLWQKLFSSMDSDSAVFAELIESLRKSMVPEAMGLAVTMAQRIAAITVMRKMIDTNKTETHLQRLIESFPWLLGPQWEKLSANENIRTLCKAAEKVGVVPDPNAPSQSEDSLKPDFVFLSDPGEEKEFIVFELKGPEAGKTLTPSEYSQLAGYINTIRSKFPNPSIRVSGVLVGAEKGGIYAYHNDIVIRTWSEVLLDARHLHVSYLKALLIASNPDANDLRMQQIADFGGKETVELLERFAPLASFDKVILESLEAIGDTPKLAIPMESTGLEGPSTAGGTVA